MGSRRQSYVQAANLAVNQTLVRSINTTVVALLPIFAILVVGFTKLGPGTLLDLSLALFVGIAVGAYSSIFIATPLLVDLRRGEPAIQELAKHTAKVQAREQALVSSGATEVADAKVSPRHTGAATSGNAADTDAAVDALGRPVHKWTATGPRNQPKRPPRSRR
jgi:preprotein translocase subunit SecF